MSKRRRIRAWCASAQAAGLQDVVGETALWSPRLLTARAGAHGVRFEDLGWLDQTIPAGDRQRIRLTIEGDSGITLRPGDIRPDKTGARETEIGDAAFDKEIYVHGPPEAVRASLDMETRRILRPLLQGRIATRGAPGSSLWAQIAVRAGDIVATFSEKETVQLQHHLEEVLKTLVAAADRLQRPASIPARIAENAREDSEWRARLAAVRLLLRQYPHHPDAIAAFEQACHDERQEVQLEAALALDAAKGEATLLEIASAEWSADALAARALTALGERIPPERVHTILDHALRSRRHETARACLDHLGRHGGSGAAVSLVKVLSLDSGDLAATAARALGRSRAAGAEEPLILALEHEVSDVRVAAAQALRDVGSAAAVLPLKEALDRDRSAPLQKAARESIAAIQSRLHGASPGQLSLTEAQAGQLSLADADPRGRVSISEDA